MSDHTSSSSSPRPQGAAPTVYVDCTETLMAGLNTGIQRVVRSVVARLPSVSERLGIRCFPVFAKDGQFWILRDPEALAQAGRSAGMTQARDRFARWEARYQQAIDRAFAHWPFLRRLALGTWAVARQGLKFTVRMLTRGKAVRRQALERAPIGTGDVLLLPDAFWASDIIIPLELARQAGANVIPVIYDIIPITHPQFFEPQAVNDFRVAFERVMGLAGGVVTDSATTLSRVRTYIQTRLPAVPPNLPGQYWYPGADLDGPRGAEHDAVRPELARLKGSEFYLMVGTLEPRKGQLGVLDAFESRWQAGDSARLVLAGRIGWRFGEIVRRLEQSPERKARLISVHDAGDNELVWLYRHATAVILASHEEGFGLPLVEAMHLGIPVIASDIPVFREVGGDYPVYFSLSQAGAVATAVNEFRERLKSGRHSQPRPWPTWDESALDLIRVVLAVHGQSRTLTIENQAAGQVQSTTVFVDCTETLVTNLQSGIQRVVRSLVARLPRVSQQLGIRCLPVFAKGGRLWVLDDPSALERPGRSDTIGQARDRFVRIEAALQGLVDRRLSDWPRFQRVTLAAWNTLRQALKRAARLMTGGKAMRGRNLKLASPGLADVLMLPDAFWTSEIVATLEAGAADGALIVPVIHDIIPLTHPQFFGPPMVKEFQTAFERLMGLSGAALAVSAATQAEVQTWLRNQAGGRLARIPVEVAHNGADLAPATAIGDADIRPELRALQGDEYFLMVGTVEPRKGQLTVLDAFETLWAAGEKARLVLAGRIGWRFAEIVQRLEYSTYAGTQLVAMHDATDAELDWLYRHATAVILASHAEGFGLPLVEAMHHGIPVLASDIPVFREVGGDYPVYFSLERPGALGESLAALRDRLRSGQRPPRRHWPTWDEAAPDFIRKALALRERVRGSAAP